ncbi:hypothetical protein Tco_1044170 [Tanacetum coccineum]|uniref:Uncharacterized protein n=1 Tax=Tanacetum coccineum TaxID=301880 RepID=A0ABQ5GQC5_9ASTR
MLNQEICLMMALTGVEQDDWSIEFDAEHMHFGQDGLDDFDWSNKADDALVSLALMATNSEGNPEEDLKDYAIIDSGCSGSMTGDNDKLSLSDFKEFKGGYVAFGNDSKGGRISGKGTINTQLLKILERLQVLKLCSMPPLKVRSYRNVPIASSNKVLLPSMVLLHHMILMQFKVLIPYKVTRGISKLLFTPDLEKKKDETEEVNIEENETLNVKSGETEELIGDNSKTFKDFIPMDSEKEREMLKEREAKRLSRKRKATIAEEQPSKKPKIEDAQMIPQCWLKEISSIKRVDDKEARSRHEVED